MNQKHDTSWNHVGKWYDKAVGEQGHYYHQNVVLPGVLRLLQLKAGNSLVDVACGQGVLARQIPKQVAYVGLDAAKSLIEFTQKKNTLDHAQFHLQDATRPWKIEEKFTHAACLLALQNMENPAKAIQQVAEHLEKKGKFLLVINHPVFRIPRQTSWEIDEANQLQYRRINRYLSPLKIPIQAAPSAGAKSKVTWSYHFPLEYFTNALTENGMVITKLEEWKSDKKSVGKAAKMENRSRDEFPMFMAILAEKR